MNKMGRKVNFLAVLNWFAFRDFLGLLPYQFYKAQSTRLFTHCWRENSFMPTFPNNEMQTALFRIWTRVAVSIIITTWVPPLIIGK